MSENTPDNAGPSGTPSAATAESTSAAAKPGGQPGPQAGSKPEATPAASTPPAAKEAAATDSPESASNITPDGAAPPASGSAPTGAAPRAGADVHRENAQQTAEMYQGRAAANTSSASSASSVERPAPMRGQRSAVAAEPAKPAASRPAVSPQVGSPVSAPASPDTSAQLAPHPSARDAAAAAAAADAASVQAAAAASSAQIAVEAAAASSVAREDGAPGAPPPGFGAAPDFGAYHPPPPGAIPPNQPAYLKRSDSAWSVFGRVLAARARQIFDRAGQRITQRTLRIGVSARLFHPEPGARGLRGKTLQYLEESIAHWVMSRDVLVFMIPTVGHQGMLHPSNIRLRDYAKNLDGLLLQGGADVSPQSYAEAGMRPEWPGDRVRDMYELELLHEFVESGKPVLGVCRGCQLINVAFGGTLYQDIATDVPTAGVHVNEQYDQHRHAVHFPDGSTLANMFPGRREAIVNSIHHQAVNVLGRDLNIEAVSAEDGIIEAVRYRRAPFVVGVQWHPEFHRAGGAELLDCTPLLDTFLRVARETRF
ncbi:gamma-glutamyl-gamma-aminobutyrate hydrolase family protein [Paraburkholderia sp. SARCC-3016]|uniref:gamma-glutamyl-gamma-aminobutyrate hydrolase family protein n=1 Tax=Paraburkholderia sp. SARCC-3016 TaxID=3058611 RepID=UPI0028076748|nr:gamma-glutamyl-gamma-aminobutyrate hydrolase family protein [Paraburkholderia sp. SARCC-3016]MDQ7978768.1 gamma-glutamyl-gamma-aminobutyrate hydrolase family protein [Paraburkholderia sp. SARCC-3016]